MQALLVEALGQVALREVARPQPGEQALVEVRAAGICGGDLHVIDGFLGSGDGSIVLGHEGSGVVTYVPPGTSDLAVGDRVVIYSRDICGDCVRCRAGQEEICERSAGQLGFTMDGTFGEVVAVPVERLLPLPETVSFETGALMGCSGLTAVHAVRISGIGLGCTVVVNGAGGLGLMTIQASVAAGATVIAVTEDPDKAALALEAGARDVVVLGAVGFEGLASRVRALTTEASHYIDTIGAESSVQAGIRAVASYGTVTVVAAAGESVYLSAIELLRSEARVLGSLSGTRADLATALDLAAHGRLFAQIDSRIPLSEAERALDRLRAGGVRGRNVIVFDPPVS